MSKNIDILALKIFEYLISQHNYKPMKVIGAEDCYFLENTQPNNKYPIINISLKNAMPDGHLSEDHAKTILSQVKKQRMILTAKIGVIAFGPALLKYETKSYDVFMCTESDLPAELFKQFPEIKEIIKNYGTKEIDQAAAQDETKKIKTEISASIINQTIVESKEISEIIRSKTRFTFYVFMVLILLPWVAQYVLTSMVDPAILESADNTILWTLVTGGSYGPLTFGLNEYWRLFSGFYVNDIFSAAILLYVLYQSDGLGYAESLYGKVKTILIIVLSGILITYTETVINLNDISYGSFPIIFVLLGMVLYYGYYNKMMYKLYASKAVRMLVPTAVFIIILYSNQFLSYGLAMFAGIMFSSIFGFKNSKGSAYTLISIFIVLMITGTIVYLQLTHKMGTTFYSEVFDKLGTIYEELNLWVKEEFLNAVTKGFK